MANVVEIVIKQSGQGNAISSTVKELGGLDSAASNSIGTLGRFGGALANMATVAGGIVVANIFGKIAQGISSVVSTGLDAVGSNQQLETSLKSLLTANNMYQETTETMTVAVGNLVEMQAEAAAKSDDLAFKQKKLTAEINTQNASIQEQRQRIMQMADGLDKNQQVARLQEMEIALEGMNRELSDTVTEQGKLNNVTQEYETVSKTTLKTVMSQADAFKLASSQTQDLLDFVSKLAVTSPFETETVEDVTKYAIAAGMGVEATKEFIPAFLDLAGAVGISSDSLGFAADQLFQVKKVGKLTEIDLRQLRRIGIDLSKVIGVEMGMSVEEFNAKAATTPEIFDELFDAVTRFSQNTFAGTSAEMATSVKGLQSTISDIFVIGSRTFMRPLVDAVTPAISGIIGKLSDFVLGGDLATIGQQVADSVMSGMAFTEEAISKVFGAFDRFGVRGAAVSILGLLGLEQEQVSIAMAMVDQIIGAISQIQTAFETFGARGAAFSIMGLLGLDSDTMVMINDTITGIVTTLTNFGAQVASVLGQISFDAILGGLAGIAAVLAGGVIMGLVTGLMALLTPVNLLIAGAALLGAAWMGNWGNIQGIVGTAVAYITEQFNALMAILAPSIASFQESFARLGETLNLNGASVSSFTTLLGSLATFLLETVIPAWVQWIGFLAGVGAAAFSAWVTYIQTAYSAFQSLTGFIQSEVVPVLMSMSDEVALVGELIGSVLAFNIAVASKALEALAGLWKNVLWPALQKVGQFLQDTIMPAFISMGTTVKSDVSPVLKDLGETVLPLLNEGLTFVIQSIKDAIGYFNSLKEAVNSFSLPDILTPGSPPPMAYALWDVGKGADAAAQAIGGMGNAMAGVNPKQFLDAMDVGGTMHALNASNVNDLKDIFKLNSQAVMDILGSGGGEGELSALLGQQAAIWGVPPQFAQDLAQANGLFGQLIDQYGEFARATRLENLGRLTQMAASFSGLGSTFAGMLEEQMAGGEEAKKTVEAYQAAINKLTASEGANQEAIDKKQLAIEKANEALGFGERQMAIYQQELDALMQDEEGNALQIEKKVLQMDKLTESMDAQSKQLLTLQSELNRLTGDMEKNQQAVKATEESYKALQAQAFDLFSGNQTDSQRISSELATIALLEDFLKSGAESFLIPADAVSQAAGITGILYDQISGQQELNRLLEEQAEREALITAQKEAQQKLDFLKSQLDLIKLGRELGGDIFQGMTFGLDASIEDLLAATNAVTQAMINQIDEDLGIASPSKVLFDKFKKQVGGGMVGGLLAVKPMIQGAIQPMLDPLLNGAAAAGRVVNNYFNQTVNTQADQSSVIGDFRTMQLMAGS